jgi:SAM-dependent methyltransferase
VKARLLDPSEPFLAELGITTADGRVKPSRHDKFRQVEEFVRALDPVLGSVADLGRPIRIVDLGCGNAYLTLAAFRHVTATRGVDAELVGVDVKAQAREHNSAVVARLGWSGVAFVEGTIGAAPVDDADVVMALHACDTATDEALARAVRWQAPVVLAAPCCHHDVQRQLRAHGRVPEPYAPLVRHGILRERFADVLTDALRAALLRLHGYRVEVIEFVESAHTPRNTLLRAVRTGAPADDTARAEYAALTSGWGVTPALERLLASLG